MDRHSKGKLAQRSNGGVDENYFDELYVGTDDPWGFRSRWYEIRKRAIVLGCLLQPRYQSAFEPACANGELVAALAPRCEKILASDFHLPAIELAAKRLAEFDNVRVECRELPQGWPQQTFDLIVLSEVGYYLDDTTLRTVAQCAAQSLTPDGTLLACHWRHPIEGCSRTGDRVHEVLRAACGAARLLHTEDDFVVEVWSPDPRSVAQRERLR